ncbi:MAG: uroporphyrinogen decarboxylase, partial [Nitrospiraceae bacterium]|nr:uroporphyrinogen decarboxylase [Nitrospiraceae bacterium]
KNFVNTKKMMYQTPELYARLMEKITDTVINYLQAQINAGVHAIQVFDSWAGILSPFDFEKYALPYVQKIVSTFKGKVPVIYFAFNASAMLKKVKQSGADILGIDWRIDIADAVSALGNDVAVQGNLDPCLLFGTKDSIKDGVSRILQGAKGAKGHIFNLGHGILPETPVDNAKTMVQAVHELSKS